MQLPEVGYLKQDVLSGFYCCEVIALLNALIFHGVPGCTSCRGTPWQNLVNLANCRKSPYDVKLEALLEQLGLHAEPIPLTLGSVADNLPVMLPIDNKMGYTHYALVIEVATDIVTMANYEGTEGTEAVNQRQWDRIPLDKERGVCHSIQLVE